MLSFNFQKFDTNDLIIFFFFRKSQLSTWNSQKQLYLLYWDQGHIPKQIKQLIPQNPTILMPREKPKTIS